MEELIIPRGHLEIRVVAHFPHRCELDAHVDRCVAAPLLLPLTKGTLD
jgi:hypothetical protein